MNTALQIDFLSVQDYLAGEEQSPVRHEYIAGAVHAMAGGSDSHNEIALNIAGALRSHLRGSPCRTYMADVKVRLNLQDTNIFYYPDVMVTCDPRDTEKYFKRHPKLIVEILSEGTERIDRMEKFWSYRQIETLEEYVLVAQDKIEVSVFRRANGWNAEVFRSRDDSVALHSVGWNGRAADFYEGVRL